MQPHMNKADKVILKVITKIYKEDKMENYRSNSDIKIFYKCIYMQLYKQ
jgi:hypothetical protein